jgi:hypothetical protein
LNAVLKIDFEAPPAWIVVAKVKRGNRLPDGTEALGDSTIVVELNLRHTCTVTPSSSPS